MALFREVEGGVAREEVERSQLKLSPNRGEYRPVFGRTTWCIPNVYQSTISVFSMRGVLADLNC